MRTHDQTEVLVVGAGPVGMFTALRLAESGVAVRLIDGESSTAGHSYACALHPRTLQLLDEVDLARDAIRLGHRIDTIAFYDGAQRCAELDLSRLPVEFPFVLVLEQKVLENLLEERLRNRAGVKVCWQHRLADVALGNGVANATIDELAMEGKGYIIPDFGLGVSRTTSTSADYVVGTDGQGSIVRQRLNIEYQRVGQSELFVVYEFETDATLAPEMRVVLDQETVGVLWPFGQNRGRWSFQWLPADPPSDFPQKDRSRFNIVDSPGPEDSRHHLQKLIDARAPWFKGNIKSVGWAADIQFEHQLVRQFGRGRAWLAGDAAHQTGPVGMQSMNMGLREGADLAGKLAAVLREAGSPNQLTTYDFEHRTEWEQLLGMNGGPTTGAAAGDWAKERCGRLAECISATGNELTLLLRQLGLHLEFVDSEMVDR